MKNKLLTAIVTIVFLLAACSSPATAAPTQARPTPSPTSIPTTVPPTQTPDEKPLSIPVTPISTLAPTATPALTLAAAGKSVSVQIINLKFVPAKITIKAGTTVIWTNKDSATHTVTSDNGTWQSDSLMTGGSYSHTFDKPGTYTYNCAFHDSMHGTVVVTP